MLNFGSLSDGVATQAMEPQITQTTPGEVLGASMASDFDKLPGVKQLRQQQRYNESGPDTPWAGAVDTRNSGSDVDAMAAERGDAPTRVIIQPDEANAKAKAAGAKVTFDKPIADSIAQSVIDHHVTEQQRADVISRNGDSILSGQAARFVVGSLISLADPINLAAMMIPAAPEAMVAERLAGAASVFERTAIRGAAGAANGAVGMAALEPLNYAMSKSDYDDWSAGDALRNIFMGAALGAGGHMLMGGLFGREHLDPNTSMEATRAAIGQAAEDRPVDVADLVKAGELRAQADALGKGEPSTVADQPSGPMAPDTAPPSAGRYAAFVDGQWVVGDVKPGEGEFGPTEVITAADGSKYTARWDAMVELKPDEAAPTQPPPWAATPDDLRAQAQTAAQDMAKRAMDPPTDPAIDQAARANKATIDSAPEMAGLDVNKDLAEATKLVQAKSQELQAEIASGRIIETQEMRDQMLDADHTEAVGKASANYASCLAAKAF